MSQSIEFPIYSQAHKQELKLSEASHSRLKIIGFLFTLMLGVVCLSVFSLSHQSLRLDESQSIYQSTHSPLGVINAISHDVHVPLYGLMLHFWMLFFGTGVASGRALSLIFFLASLPAIYFLGKEAADKKVGLFAAFLVAISPFLNWYGNEMRMYSLLFLVTIINQYFFIRIYKAGKSKIDGESLLYLWWGYGVSAFFGIYTHYFFWFVLLTEAVFFFLSYKDFPKKTFRNFIIVAALLVVAISPWLIYVKLYGGLSNQSPLLTRPSTVDFFNVFSQFIFGFQDDHINAILLSLWPIIVLLAFLRLRKNEKPLVAKNFFFLAALLPLIISFALSLLIEPVFLARYLIPAIPALYIFLAWFVSAFPPLTSRLFKVVLSVAMLLTLFQQVASANTPSKENYEQVSNYITAHASDQDAVVLSAPFTIYPFEYYYAGPDSIYTLPNWNQYQVGPIPAFSFATLPAQVNQIAQNHQDIWLVLSYNQGYQDQIFNYFETHFQRLAHENFSPGLDLYEYKIKYNP